MESIQSQDGTAIAFQRSGEGPPLVLVHGTLGSHGGWASVQPLLNQHFTVYAIDRRGRGASGDGPDYSLAREAEDIAALVEVIGGGVNLLGHSFGGLIVLEAALLTDGVRSLIVYEPTPLAPPGMPLYPDEIVSRLQALLDAGDREGVVIAMFRDLVGMSEEDLEHIRTSPRFPAWTAAAHTVLRETRAEQDYRFDPARFVNLTTPALLLLGGDSPDFFRRTTETWHETLSGSRIVILPDQQHLAQSTDPGLFAREVIAFLTERD